MFYETAQTMGPGWHRSYKPSHYEDMTWSPNSKSFRSPGSSPETYRRIIQTEEDFPERSKENDEFFGGRRSPLSRRIFKEVWSDSPSNSRYSDRHRIFKKGIKPDHWDDEFERDVPHLRRVQRQFNHSFDDERPMSRNFDDEFKKRFNARDMKKNFDEEFQKAEGRVHHIPIMVEKRMEEIKSRIRKKSPPPTDREQTNDEEYAEDWVGPKVQNLRNNFEPDERYSSKYSYCYPRSDKESRTRAFTSPFPDTWDPHAIHTLPTRKAHKNTQSFDDSRHNISPKSVFRSYSETHEDIPRQQPQHSAAFRSHSDGHCPNQTYVTKIEVNMPSEKEREELRSKYSQKETQSETDSNLPKHESHEAEFKDTEQQTNEESPTPKPRIKVKNENPSLQQIAVVLQNVEDLIQRVEGYSGTGRDKQYRFLDEMLTRCMLRLDDVDTEGREDIRSARKAAVREVQNCIDKLEAKADESERKQKENSNSNCDESTETKENVEQEQKELTENMEEQEPQKEDLNENGSNEQTRL